ncbi:MAG: acyl-CoA dehydrogenase [Alphaproteobacteria bacterium]|nr:MAG: acyl-CoA dehydrogenase [Alphaproteobacteria bacterium]
MSYTPPIEDQLFILKNSISVSALQALPGQDDLDEDLIDAVLEEAGKLARDVLAPINHSGDQDGSIRHEDGSVTTAKGWIEAYNAYRDGGWNSVPFSPDHGGQGLPWTIAFCVQEMWQGANMSFGLCPLLNQGAIEAIEAHASDDLKETYLEKLISGTWTGTMNLTEPQAGSDLAAIKSKAEPASDGSYRIFGQKIFITYGEHDLADNIIHLVLARLPDAPEGVKGISLFIVPKILEDGSRNDVTCTGIEHKLGINASPTCTMQFGDNDGAIGYLVGQPHMGLKYMFTMMNNARLSVGLQGVAIAERALQHASIFAAERVQGGQAPIKNHPDVKRMLMTMDALTQAGRAMTLEAAFNLDTARAGNKDAQEFVDLMTPVVKSWCTDNALEVTSLGVQIHGGMGFVEETGAAQYYRDARILPIYEGTNGIQALDLVFRKIMRDKGAALTAWIATHENYEGINLLKQAAHHLATLDQEQASFIATPFLNLFGVVAGHIALQKQMEVINNHENAEFKAAKQQVAAFYQANILPRAAALHAIVMHNH